VPNLEKSVGKVTTANTKKKNFVVVVEFSLKVKLEQECIHEMLCNK
jgi:hypothetical protein